MWWSIETFFKVTKSYLKLGTEFQGRSFDALISHTTIVFSRYLAMEYERRQSSNDRTLGGLFFLFADEVRDLAYQTALQQLKSLLLEMSQAKTKKNKTTVFCQLQEWISGLPSYIKGLFGDLSWSSRREPHGPRPSQIRTCPIKAYGCTPKNTLSFFW